MAARLARAFASSSSSPSSSSASINPLIQISTASDPYATRMGHGAYSKLGRACSSSSSSSFSPTSSPTSSPESKPDKKIKLTERLSAVIDAVNDRKLPPELRGQRNNIRSETDIINVVEQRIWHSMEEGQFENLPGKGKPLTSLTSNPHVDPAEDTLYRILSKNGCAPEWVELNKEVRSRVSEWRLALKRAWGYRCNGDDSKWAENSELLQAQLRDINDKVFRYNLIVPFGRQMFGLKWEKELDRLNES